MTRSFVLMLLLFCSSLAQAQSSLPASGNDKNGAPAGTDNDSSAAGSHVAVSIGIGNKLFSVKNNTLNTFQSKNNNIYYTPSLAYQHKSGLGISVTSFISFEKSNMKLYQTALTPSYSYSGDKLDGDITYSHYFSNSNLYNPVSLYQNEVYADVSYKAGFIVPGISVDYSTGSYKEISADTINLSSPKVIMDSTQNRIKDFLISAQAAHAFSFDGIFTGNDGITFTPQAALSFGNGRYSSSLINKGLKGKLKKSALLSSRRRTNNTALGVQSLSLDLDLSYSIGKLSLEPDFYLDYFLPKTTEKKLTSLFSFKAAFTF